jgi:transmembrane protein
MPVLTALSSAANAPRRFLDTLVRARATWIIARIALTAAFWWGGVAKLLDFSGAVAEVRALGLEPAALIAVATIVTELGASILLIFGRVVWLAAGALAVFTILATLLAHAFWSVPAADQLRELNVFLEHIGLVGGFMLAAILADRHKSARDDG